MSAAGSSNGKGHAFDRTVLLLQGGGALGSYQGGVYQALAEAGLHPDWVAGISIGAVNSALIAGNEKARRVERLREFWEAVTASPFGIPTFSEREIHADFVHGAINQMRAFGTLIGGAPDFFTLRLPPPYLAPSGSVEALSYYDVSPLKATLERLVDFDRINQGELRFSVGATNVRTGNFAYFDTKTHHIRAEHVMASGALPPGFPPIEIEGEHYWDGGIVSNTPLQWVLDSTPRQDTLAFQVDSVERARRVPARPHPGGGAPEGHPVLLADPRRQRSVQEAAAAAPGDRPCHPRAAREAARRPSCPPARGGGRQDRLQHRAAHLPRQVL